MHPSPARMIASALPHRPGGHTLAIASPGGPIQRHALTRARPLPAGLVPRK